MKLLNTMKSHNGAVLLEFAFAIPILVLVIYCVLDIPNAYRLSLKLQKISELYAQTLMNIGTAGGDKTITISDLENISKSVGITFAGMIKNRADYHFHLSTYIICIKGKGENSFDTKWSVHIQNDLKNNTITSTVEDYNYSVLNKQVSAFLGNIKGFSIEKNELKLIIESVIWYKDDPLGFNSKFYILRIPEKTKNDAKIFGDKNAIITPPYGLAKDTAPTKPVENVASQQGSTEDATSQQESAEDAASQQGATENVASQQL